MTSIFIVGAVLLFGHAFVKLVTEAPPAEHQVRE